MTTIPNEYRPQRSLLNPVDLRALEYVASYDHNLMCAICHCPFVFPVKLDCDHVFCQRCINEAMMCQNRLSRNCPTCRRRLDATSITPVPKILERILDELLVKCPLDKEGCKEIMPRSRVQDHVFGYCPYAEVDCPSKDCFLTLQRKDNDEEQCLHFDVVCEDCMQSMMKKDLESHRTLHCEVAGSPCPDCRVRVLACDLGAHLECCPDAVYPCTAASYGCDFISKRSSLDNHLEDCPLAKMMPFLKKQNDRLDVQELALKHLRHKNSVLETSFSAIQETLDSSANLMDAPSSSAIVADNSPFDSTAHHLLCLHESLRQEVDRVSTSVSEIDAKANMMVMNENLRVKEELARTNAAIGSMRMQLHWLVSAKLQEQQKRTAVVMAQPAESRPMSRTPSASDVNGESSVVPIRRLSDSSRQETKL